MSDAPSGSATGGPSARRSPAVDAACRALAGMFDQMATAGPESLQGAGGPGPEFSREMMEQLNAKLHRALGVDPSAPPRPAARLATGDINNPIVGAASQAVAGAFDRLATEWPALIGVQTAPPEVAKFTQEMVEQLRAQLRRSLRANPDPPT